MAKLTKANMITQAMLEKYLRLEAANKEFEELKKELVQKLKDGHQIQNGKFVASIKKGERRSVSWKDEFVKVTSPERAEEIINKTPYSTTYTLIVVNREEPIKE